MTDGNDPEHHLAGASGDDVSGGTSVSGVGGESLRANPGEPGLPPVWEGGTHMDEGGAPDPGVETPAGNDGTGQSEKPPPEEDR